MSKRAHEKAIFEAFLRVVPDFAEEVITGWKQPVDEKEFPDIICESESSHRVGVELVEWLNEEETSVAKGTARIQESILRAIGEQGDNRATNIFAVFLFHKAKALIKPDDTAQFRIELFQFIQEVDRRWPSERFWQCQRGHCARAKYRTKV
jgi:hypothetical protein